MAAARMLGLGRSRKRRGLRRQRRPVWIRKGNLVAEDGRVRARGMKRRGGWRRNRAGRRAVVVSIRKERKEKGKKKRERAPENQCNDGKERERENEREREKERDPEKGKKVQHSKNERAEDDGSRKEEHPVKKDVVITELQDEIRNPELEKELEKRMKRRRDGSGDNNNFQGDGKETDARHIYSKDDHSKNGSYKDGRYREKNRDDLDRDQRQRDDKRRDAHASRIHTSDWSDNKYSIDGNKYPRDENRLSENRYKTKLQYSDHDGSPHVDEHGIELKNIRGRKRSSDDIEDSNDVRPRIAKESREDTERNGSRSAKLDSCSDKAREHPHPDKVDSGLSSSRPKSSPGSSAYAVKDQTRHNSRQAESSRRESLPEETRRPRITSRADHHTASGGRERVSESWSMEKTKLKDDTLSDVLLSDPVASHYDKTLRSDIRGSPNQLTEKSPTSTSDRRSERIGPRRILDVEEGGQRSSTYKDGRNSSSSKGVGRDRELPADKLKVGGSSQVELLNSEPSSLAPSSYKRTANSQGTSPGHLPPPPPVRQGVGSPSVLGPYEDENRIQNVDRKTNNRYRRSSDVSAGRGQGTPWKSTMWSPSGNGFIPLQHGPPAGFHPVIQQFPAPPLFGVRPAMGSYHPHEANRFSGHARPYGWHNPVDACPPHLQLWDGSNNMFGDESNMYGRPDWDQSRHLRGDRGWEINADMWNGQNGNGNMEFPVPRKEQEYSTQALADETWAGQSGHHSHDERTITELPTADAGGIIRPINTSPPMNALGIPPKSLHKKVFEAANMPSVQETSEKQSNNYVRFCCNYLSKLGIAPDLVQTELYEQCMSLMETKDGALAGNVQGHRKNNKSQDAKVAAKSKNYFLNSRSSTSVEVVFQRAMSLYKKQKAAVKEAMNPPGLQLVASVKEEKVPLASVGEKVSVNSPDNMEDDLPIVGVTSAFPMEVEKRATIDAEGDHPEDEEKHDRPTDTEEKQCDSISESVVLAEGSEDCEALMPECRVNLSRIHLSLESTH
ncbi:zinc finger CCCH domain-containing protein 13-like [Iris pallida]|uniref:Zinc finger CCCH domain-containing protein 13-like n=1 Tax=Iris pallida TaxID=29817 RepID=A0AAX6EYM2_IRIPA|nr:zinc finger CCCH domain-containing protein 13-like [Iris pallida]